MTKKGTEKFKGKLQDPLIPPRRGLLEPPEWMKKEMPSRGRDVWEKLGLLLDHYGIEKKPQSEADLVATYVLLSIELAKEAKIPGFLEESDLKSKGRKVKWNPQIHSYLYADVQRVLYTKPGRTLNWAFIYLEEREPWKAFVERKEGALTTKSGDALKKQYHTALKKDDVFKELQEFHMKKLVDGGKENEWILEVESVLKK